MKLSLGSRIKAARALLGWSQRDFATLMGLTVGTVVRLERDDTTSRTRKLAVQTLNRHKVILLLDGVRFIRQ